MAEENENINTNIRNLEGSEGETPNTETAQEPTETGEPPNRRTTREPGFIKGVEGTLPQLEDFVATNRDPDDATVEEYSNYLIALENYIKEPKQEDYVNENAYRMARKEWLASFANMDILTDKRVVDSLRRSNVPAVANLVRPGGRTRLRKAKVQNFTEAELNEFVSAASSAYLGSIRDEFKKSYEEEEREEAENNARINAAEQRATAERNQQSGLIRVPGFNSLVEAGLATSPLLMKAEPAGREGPREVTYNKWRDIFTAATSEKSDTYAPDFIEEFKNYLVDTGVLSQEVAMNMLPGNDPAALDILREEWLALGAYAAKKYEEGEKVDIDNPDFVVEYNEYSQQFDLQARDAETAAKQQLTNFFVANGLTYTQQYINEKAKQIVKGETTVMQEASKFRENVLVREYPEWADSIRSGVSVRELADSYISQMATMLEVDENTIDLKDPRLQASISGRDEKGNQKMLTLSEQRDYLSKLPEWKQTKRAKRKRAEAAEFILGKFGKV